MIGLNAYFNSAVQEMYLPGLVVSYWSYEDDRQHPQPEEYDYTLE